MDFLPTKSRLMDAHRSHRLPCLLLTSLLDQCVLLRSEVLFLFSSITCYEAQTKATTRHYFVPGVRIRINCKQAQSGGTLRAY